METNNDYLNLNKKCSFINNSFQKNIILFSCNCTILENKKIIKLSICISSLEFFLFNEKMIVFKSDIKLVNKILYNIQKELLILFFGENVKINLKVNSLYKLLINFLNKFNKNILFYIIENKIEKKISKENILKFFDDSQKNFKKFTSTNVSSNDESIDNINDFQIEKIIGIGGYGEVVLAYKLYNYKKFAIKILKKIDIIKRKQVKNVQIEKQILEKLNNYFIVNSIYFFTSFSKLYFIMNYFDNGTLLDLLIKEKSIDEEKAKFYIASVCLGLHYLHKKNYIYRDLKLENILINKRGYIKLSDFGISKYLSKRQKAYEFVGTPEYIAPEIIKNTGYNFEIDYWGLGIISYELLNGHWPFFDKEKTKIYIKILKENPNFDEKLNWSNECKEFIKDLWNKNPEKRLGSKKGINDIINHRFFKNFDWNALIKKKYKPPFKKNIKPNKNFGKYEEHKMNEISIEDVDLLKKYENII